jgi:WD40 repeat protein
MRMSRILDPIDNIIPHPLYRHDGPIWQISWAHPKFGCILASCSYDGKVFVWREQNGQWARIKEHVSHTASGKGLLFEMDSEQGAFTF